MLEEEREAPLDPLLATLVRLKVAGDEATKPVWYTVPPTDQSSFQYIMQMRALQARIVQIKQDAPKDAEYESEFSFHIPSFQSNPPKKISELTPTPFLSSRCQRNNLPLHPLHRARNL